MSNIEALPAQHLSSHAVDRQLEIIKLSAADARKALLLLYDGQAHISKGLDSFDEFCRVYLELEYGTAYIRHMRLWARIESRVCCSIRKSDAEALSKLPDNEQSAAWGEVQEALRTGDVQDKNIVEHIVARRLKAIAAPTEKNSATSHGDATKPRVATDAAVVSLPAQDEQSAPVPDDLDETDDGPEDVTLFPQFMSVSLHPDDKKYFQVTGSLDDGTLVLITVPFTPVATLERQRRK